MPPTKLPHDLVQRAHDTPIEQVIAARGITLKRNGAAYLDGPCPICGGDDRFNIKKTENLYYCRGCQKGGDAIELTRELDGVSFRNAVLQLVGEPIQIPARPAKPKPEKPKVEAPKSAPTTATPERSRDVPTFPPRTPPDKNGKPAFVVAGDEGIAAGGDEIRRHVYRQGGIPVRIKVKTSGGWFNVYRVTDPAGSTGWQYGKPAQYHDVPYFTDPDPFADGARPLYWPEGEKDVETLVRLGLSAFTFGGTSDLPEGCAAYVAKRHVVILADNDNPGRGAAAAKVAVAMARGAAASVKVIQFEDKDVSDWIEAGHTADELEARVDAAELLHPVNVGELGLKAATTVEGILSRFIAYPSLHCRKAHTLWIMHTHVIRLFDTTPRIAFLSPEPSSGKSRALEITERLVPQPVATVNVSPAYLFRKIGDGEGDVTILFDEIDTVFGPRAKENEEIRGLLNAGYRRGATAGRCVIVGNTVETEEIPAFAPVALAGLGWLPDTILSRSIIVRMRRRAPSEYVEPYRRRIHDRETDAVLLQLQAWAEAAWPDGLNEWPELPREIQDRDADIWEPLIVIADAIGGDWPEKAREAAVALVAASKDREASLGIRLLADLRRVFGGLDQMRTVDVLRYLTSLDEAPWGDLKGKPLDAHGLAVRLREYDVKPRVLWFGEVQARGYLIADFREPWARYLNPTKPEASPPSPPDNDVMGVTPVTRPPPLASDVTPVTGVTPLAGEERGDDSNPIPLGEDDWVEGVEL